MAEIIQAKLKFDLVMEHREIISFTDNGRNNQPICLIFLFMLPTKFAVIS